MNYDVNKDKFFQYIESCRVYLEKNINYNISKSVVNNIRAELINKNKIDSKNNYSDIELILLNKKNMIDNKISHTMRVVEDASKVAAKMDMPFDFINIVKTAGLLHDIGRFEQVKLFNDYSDKNYINMNIPMTIDGINKYVMNHSEHGYKLLENDNYISSFDIDPKYRYIISNVVLHHGDPKVPDYFSNNIDYNINRYKIKQLLSEIKPLNEQERVICSLVLQIIKDVDMLDILYQSLTGDIPVVRNKLVCKETSKGIDYICNKYKVNKKHLKDLNELVSDDIIDMSSIVVPLDFADLCL